MIYGYSADQIRSVEVPHLAAGEPLMQRAAAGLAAEVRRQLHDRQRIHSPSTETVEAGRVLLLVGSGDNGGDALYAGAELAASGVDVAVVTTGSRVHEDGLAAATRAGARLLQAQPDEAAALARRVDVIVDGILGTGISANPALRGRARDIVQAILPIVPARPAPTASGVGARPIVIAVDIPSGINPNDGSVPDAVVLPADITVTFGGYKAGLLLAPASEFAGEVHLIDIGLGPDLEQLEPTVRVP